MTLERLRKEFPQLEKTVYGKPLVYLDNAATSLRPRCVVDRLVETSLEKNSNIHRAVHYFAGAATGEFEAAREAVRAYVNAPSTSNIIFTSGTTAGINLVASCYGQYAVNQGDEIIVGEAEHHSNIVPWQMLCERRGASIRVLPVDDSGRLRIEELPALINARTRLVAVAHISNVLGIINPVGEVVRMAHAAGVPVLVDGAQGIVHSRPDVQAIGCDFYAFSGHKIYAATGTGALYMADPWTEKLGPWQGGGEMIQTVKWSGTTYAPSPQKFEAGTQNINAVPTLVPALELAAAMEDAQAAGALTEYVTEELEDVPGLTLYGKGEGKVPLFSFSVKGAHHEDIALLLDKMGIAVRSGQVCAEPLMDRFGVTGIVRASFAPYNTVEEAQYFIESLRKAVKMLI